MSRVKGVKEKSAAKLSAEGLTINGQAFPHAAEHAGEGRAEEDRHRSRERTGQASKRVGRH